jgi:hypothetical protein
MAEREGMLREVSNTLGRPGPCLGYIFRCAATIPYDYLAPAPRMRWRNGDDHG